MTMNLTAMTYSLYAGLMMQTVKFISKVMKLWWLKTPWLAV